MCVYVHVFAETSIYDHVSNITQSRSKSDDLLTYSGDVTHCLGSFGRMALTLSSLPTFFSTFWNFFKHLRPYI